jgi:hypothetical protein
MTRVTLPKHLIALLALYCAASLVHFVHNAQFLADYPNMPAWLSPLQVMGAWLGVTAVGVLGWLVTRTRWPLAGLLLIAAYAGLGFDGLAHYTLAPMAAHSLAMNLTIWSEVVAAALLLVATARLVLKTLWPARVAASALRR